MLKRVLNIQPAAAPAAAPPAEAAVTLTPEAVLRLLLEQLRPLRGEMSVFAPRLGRALDQADWALASRTLLDLVQMATELSGRAPARRESIELEAPAGADAWQSATAMLLECEIGRADV